MRRRGFTLIEAIIAVVVLALLVPTSVAMMADAASSRAQSLAITRATWLAAAVMEQIIADVNSDEVTLGFGALESPETYLETPLTGLYARMEPVASFYEELGIEYEVSIGELVSADGTVSGDADENVYRYVQVEVTWRDRRSGSERILPLGALLTDLTP